MADLLHDAEFGQVGRVREPPVEADQGGHGVDRRYSCLTFVGFGSLTLNSALAAYRSFGDAASVAFVSCSYVSLLLLFNSLRLFEAGRDRSKRRRLLLAVVWVLTTLQAIMFSYKVATVMPLAMAVIVWAMAATSVVGVYYAFFRR